MLHQRSTGSRGTLLVVGGAEGGRNGATKPFRCLDQARARGLRVVLLDTARHLARSPDAVAIADEVHELDYFDHEQLRLWAATYPNEIDYVFAYGEGSDLASAIVGEIRQLPWNPVEPVRVTREKDLSRETLRRGGFPQPQCRRVRGMAEAEAFMEQHRGPWVCKPLDSAASRGVTLVRDPSELTAAAARLEGWTEGTFVIEQYVPSRNYMADGVILAGQPKVLVLSDRFMTGEPLFLDMGFAMPSALLSAEQYAEVSAEIERAVRVLGLTHGLFHIEFWFGEDTGLVLGEPHARCGGQLVDQLIELAIPGLELFGAVYDDLLGDPPPVEKLTPTRGAVSRYLMAPPGRVEAIEGWDAVAADPRCRHASLAVQPGDVQPSFAELKDRSAVLVAAEPTVESSHRALDEWSETLRFVMQDEAAGVV